MHVADVGNAMKLQNESLPYCSEHERLKDAFLEAVRGLADLQALQMNAVVDDDPRFVRFDDLIQRARRAKDEAKYALVAHMESHCYRKSCEGEATIYREDLGQGAQSWDGSRLGGRAGLALAP